MIHTILTYMGHPQPTTTLQVANSFTNGIIYVTMQQHQSKDTNMRLYWIKYCKYQEKLHIHWRLGINKLVD